MIIDSDVLFGWAIVGTLFSMFIGLYAKFCKKILPAVALTIMVCPHILIQISCSRLLPVVKEYQILTEQKLMKLNETGQQLQLIEAFGQVAPAMIKELSGVAKEIAAPIANVDKIEIIDFGGENKGVDAMTKIVPSVAKQLLEGFSAVGLQPSELLKKIGLKQGSK